MEQLIGLIFIAVLATFAGAELIGKVPPQLHTPLMSVSNAISGRTRGHRNNRSDNIAVDLFDVVSNDQTRKCPAIGVLQSCISGTVVYNENSRTVAKIHRLPGIPTWQLYIRNTRQRQRQIHRVGHILPPVCSRLRHCLEFAIIVSENCVRGTGEGVGGISFMIAGFAGFDGL